MFVCCSLHTSYLWWFALSMQHQLRGCNNVPSFWQWTAPIAHSFCEGCTWHHLHILVKAPYIHGPCRHFHVSDQNDEDTRTFCGKFLYNAIASTDNVTAQHKNCPSSGIDDRPGRDLFRVLKRSPISQPHTLGLRRDYSDGKAVGGLRQRLHPH